MKKAVITIFILFPLLITMVIVAQPEPPETQFTVENKVLAKLCLSHIPKYYDAGQLTYVGHTKAWVYRWLDRLGIKFGRKYLADYSSLEDAVNCYITTSSGDVSINMTMPPAEFYAAYELLAKNYAIRGIQEPVDEE